MATGIGRRRWELVDGGRELVEGRWASTVQRREEENSALLSFLFDIFI
jgi:hypothetical protein